MLRARRQFAYCTDYESGMNVAGRVMRENADATSFYVLTFGDLIHEPPTTTYRKCAMPTGNPPEKIDWETLQHASLGFYVVSTDFKLRPNQRWPELLESHGIYADFKDMAQTMTQAVELPPPPRAVYRPSSEEIAAAEKRWHRMADVAMKAGKVAIGGMGVVTIAMFGFIWWGRRRGRQTAN